MREQFVGADEKFVKPKKVYPSKYTPIQHYKFDGRPNIRKEPGFDRNALPIVFRVSPDTLLNLCIKIIDAMPLPDVYKWTNVQVCKWIRKYGYPQYMNTFRVNLITGQKLLLLDAQSLCAMNIKNFDHIKHIAYGIRRLFFFEMTKHIRQISLPPEFYYELYQLFEVKSGRKYEEIRRSDLWRRMQLLRKKTPNYSHWELLERWLAREYEQSEIFGGVSRYRLYKCIPKRPQEEHIVKHVNPCNCMPPCSCYWTEERHLKKPSVFSLLKPHRKPDPCYDYSKNGCKDCAAPCTCQWPSRFYKFDLLLTCLKTSYPAIYGDKERELRRPKFAIGLSFNNYS
ncbi:uncharacterized protein [Eurosta solidaginis]|uniref:uncharacterized protein n=1 Tax=Eurosta solidaginis TaxID=178769 RepID=UPI00353083DC